MSEVRVEKFVGQAALEDGVEFFSERGWEVREIVPRRSWLQQQFVVRFERESVPEFTEADRDAIWNATYERVLQEELAMEAAGRQWREQYDQLITLEDMC